MNIQGIIGIIKNDKALIELYKKKSELWAYANPALIVTENSFTYKYSDEFVKLDRELAELMNQRLRQLIEANTRPEERAEIFHYFNLVSQALQESQ